MICAFIELKVSIISQVDSNGTAAQQGCPMPCFPNFGLIEPAKSAEMARD
jgi:hypothetical protein